MSDASVCPYCSVPMNSAFLYVRGIFSSLHRSSRADVSAFSRTDLQQINLGDISQTGTGAQAVVKALHCESCDSMSFKASP